MAEIDKDTANWRLFGGGGLLVGGLLWTLYAVLGMAKVDMGAWGGWVLTIGLLVVGIGFFLVAWGQTGSNGAVGNNMMGKVALWAAALGFVLWGVMYLLALLKVDASAMAEAMGWIIAVLIVLGLALGALVIMQKGVANGLAKWVGFLTALAALLYFLGANGWVDALGEPWVGLVFAAVTAVTGLLYVMNRK